jgi:phosphohistidine phosphatase
MELIFWRHADAENGIPDDERRLTAKGLKQAERMAAWLGKRLPDDYLVLASPARRAQETARALTKKFDTRREIGTLAGADDVLRSAGWPHADSAVVVVGHQPTLGQAAALVLTGKILDWNIKKGAVWWFTWRATEETAQLRAAISPDLL